MTANNVGNAGDIVNRFGTDTIINVKMGKILLESNAINNKENVWIKDLLKEKQEPILKYDEIQELKEDKKEFLTSSLFTNFYKTVCKEWEMVDLIDDDKKIECSLCGQKDTKKKYYIRNKLNGTVLNVGSTCINNFDDIEGANGKTRQEIEKEWKMQNRDKLLNQRYPGIIGKMDQWSKKFEEIPTIITENLEDEYFSISKEAFALREKFRKESKVNYNIAKEINDLVIKGENVLEKIYKDIDEKKKNEWFITKEIKQWCNITNIDKTTETFLKQDGLITWRSACRIYETNLVEKIIEKLKKIFDNLKILIRNFDDKRNGIVININDGNIYNNRIDLICSYNDFMLEYGGVIFENKTEIANEKQFVIEHSKIVDDTSFNISVSNLKYLLRKYSLNIESWNLDYNEIIFTEYTKTKEILYKILDLKKFVNNFLSYIFKKHLDKIELEKIKKYIQNSSSTMTDKEYKDILERREIEEKAMQVDYSKFV